MEFVFVVPRTAIFPEFAPHGLSAFGEEFSRERFQRCVEEEGFFVEREYAERTPTLKQIIPYTLVTRGEEILLLQRTKGGGEARLHNKFSIGVGGHVNPVDATSADGEGTTARLLDPLPAATRREVMEEELIVEGDTRLTAIGLLNDDSNAVGAVHVGLVQTLELLGGDAQIREVDQLRGDFVPWRELPQQLAEGANFETWSSLLVPHLDHLLSPSTSAADGVREAAEGSVPPALSREKAASTAQP